METKICTKCNLPKNIDEFRWRNKSKGTKTCWCNECYKIYEKDKWKSSKERREGNKKRNRLRRIRNQQFVWDYLKTNGCEECPEKNPIVLTFDHLDRNSKITDISVMSRGSWSLEAIKEEIEKCRVLCSNCHMKHTAEQMGWYKNIKR